MVDATTAHSPADHEVLAAVLQVRAGSLQVLLWERALEPHAHRWSLPGGRLGPDEDVEASIKRQLAEKVDVRQLSQRAGPCARFAGDRERLPWAGSGRQ